MSPPQIGAPDRAGKQRVADEERDTLLRLLRVLRIFPYRQAHAARAVSGRVQHANLVAAEPQRPLPVIETIDRRLRSDREPEHLSLLLDTFVEEVVVAMEPDGHAEDLFRPRDARDVIEVRVRQENVADRQTPALHGREQLIHLVAGIHDDALMRVLAPDDESVLVEGLDRRVLQHHRSSVSHRPARRRMGRRRARAGQG
jgi:hypothetical protein